MGEYSPVGSQLSSTTSHPNSRNSLGMTMPPTEFTASTITLKCRFRTASASTSGRANTRRICVVVRFPRNDLADMVHIRENEVLVFGQRQHPLALGVAQKFSLGIQELQGVPLAGVVRCGDDDAAVGPVRRNGQFGSRRSAESDVHYVRAAAQQRAFDDVADHFARNTGVATHDDFEPFPGCGFGDETHVSGGEFNDIERVRFSVAGPPIVPRMPEMDLMRVMSQISLFL